MAVIYKKVFNEFPWQETFQEAFVTFTEPLKHLE